MGKDVKQGYRILRKMLEGINGQGVVEEEFMDTEIKESESDKIRISHRASAGLNDDDLYLIPSAFADRDEFPVSATLIFKRSRGGAYSFSERWKRQDGEACLEEPGMIYAMGHVVLMELPLETTLPEEKV